MTTLGSSRTRLTAALLVTCCLLWHTPVIGSETRLKDIVTLHGVSMSPLLGYGLVVGLNKTGDKRQTLFSTQSLTNMLSRFGIEVPADQVKVENIAAVLVTAEMSPYQRVGARLDATASSIGDARSLQGGTLMPTPLHGPNGELVALAQGPLSIGGFGGGRGATSVQVNHLTVGRVPGGAIVQVAPAPAVETVSGPMVLVLREPDFVTATRIVQAINSHLGVEAARALDPGSVSVDVPASFRSSLPTFVAQLETLPIDTDVVARVVINERTGTVVVGGNVRLGPAAVAHGNLSVRITTRYQVSQPLPYTRGDTVTVPEQDVDVEEGTAQLIALEAGTTLQTVVSALNALGVSPRDVIAIVQALKAAGALQAEIVIL